MATPCPLCGATFDDDAGFSGHLADAHDLVDEPGTTTTLSDVVFEPRPPTPGPPLPPSPREHALEPLPPDRRSGERSALAVVVAVIVAIGVIAGAYVVIVKNDDSKPAAEPPPTTTTSPHLDWDVRTPEQKAADRVAAEAALVNADDLAGWTATPPDNSDSPVDPAVLMRYVACSGVDFTELGGGPYSGGDPGAESPSFEMENDVTARAVANGVTAFATPHNGGLFVEAMRNLLTRRCLTQLLGDVIGPDDVPLPPGVTIGQYEAASMTGAGLPGDGARGRALFAVRGPGGAAEGYVELVFVSKGRWVASFSLLSINGAFPESQLMQLAQTVYDRLPST